MTELNIFHNASHILYIVWSTVTNGGVKGERQTEGEGVKRKIKREEQKGGRGERQREGGREREVN